MDLRGRGIAQVEGKTVYVEGALAGEQVAFVYTRIRREYDEGRVVEVLASAPERVEPGCPQFGICGGCSLQHLKQTAQRRYKHQALLDILWEVGGVAPAEMLDPLASNEVWGYRQKARLGVKYVAKKNKVLVGFRERGSGFLTDTERCPVLDPRVGELIEPLSQLVGGLSLRDQIPQLEVAMGDRSCVLIFRLLAQASDQDRDQLLDFSQQHDVAIYTQEAGPESVVPLTGSGIELSYRLPSADLELYFLPTDFTQVNPHVNRLMVERALQLLAPETDDLVLDLFCGVGNFTLPIARLCRQVIGVEGDPGLVARAQSNAVRNGIGNASFQVADLYQIPADADWLEQGFKKALLDPPRSGAGEVLDLLPGLGISRIVYVSCNPETLARDSAELVQRLGYRLLAAGMIDMFPHTSHLESIALFQR